MRNEEIKKYKKELEVAINEVLTDAPEIKGAIEKIREEGYDIFLMVEATIGFNKCQDGSSQEITPHRRQTASHLPGREVSAPAQD